MADLFARDTEIALLLTAAILVVVAIQLILCFKAKKKLFKLLPPALCALAAIVCYVLAITAKDWSGFIYGIVAVCLFALLFFCAVAWLIYAGVRLVKKAFPKSRD